EAIRSARLAAGELSAVGGRCLFLAARLPGRGGVGLLLPRAGLLGARARTDHPDAALGACGALDTARPAHAPRDHSDPRARPGGPPPRPDRALDRAAARRAAFRGADRAPQRARAGAAARDHLGEQGGGPVLQPLSGLGTDWLDAVARALL